MWQSASLWGSAHNGKLVNKQQLVLIILSLILWAPTGCLAWHALGSLLAFPGHPPAHWKSVRGAQDSGRTAGLGRAFSPGESDSSFPVAGIPCQLHEAECKHQASSVPRPSLPGCSPRSRYVQAPARQKNSLGQPVIWC